MKLQFILGLCLIVGVQLSLQDEKPKNDDLPLLMKTHRLRPGSGDDIQKIVGDYINEQQGGASSGDHDKPAEEMPLPGKTMIGKHRHPKGEKKEESNDLPLLMKTHRLRPGSVDDIDKIIENYIKAHQDDTHDIEKRDAFMPGKQKIPPLVPQKNDDIKFDARPKRDAPKEENDIPLLMKTHRLRPGSGDEINNIIENYVNAHKNDDHNEENKPFPGEPLIGKHRHPKGDKKGDNKPADEMPFPGKTMIGKHRHPKGEKKEESNDLPLLMKTHRLRPGSGDKIQKIVDDYINSQKSDNQPREKRAIEDDKPAGEEKKESLLSSIKNKFADGWDKLTGSKPAEEEKPEPKKSDLANVLKHLREGPGSIDEKIGNDKREADEDNEELDGDIRPLGMGLIGSFRRPAFARNSPDGKPAVVDCKEEDRQQVLKCFGTYLKNFDIELVDGKLPSMYEIYGKIKTCKDYKKQKEFFENFAGCYKSTPETCFHAGEISKISHQPEEADYLSTWFTIIEYMFKSKHNKKVAKCFIKQVEASSQHKFSNFKECDTAKEILTEAIGKFKENCAKTQPQDGDLKALLQPFLRRTSLGPNCPTLLSDINV